MSRRQTAGEPTGSAGGRGLGRSAPLGAAFAAALALVLGLALPVAAAARPLPKVWIYGPIPPPCRQTVTVHGKPVMRRVACYEVRPSTIDVSVDGNGLLSGLHWTSWTYTKATGTGSEYLRCYHTQGYPQPHCPAGRYGYETPVSVALSRPLATADGLIFTELTEDGKREHCISPLGVACNYFPAPNTTVPSPVTVAGPWEWVGFSAQHVAVDIVRLDLVDFPPGHLTGSWSETVAPGYEPGLALDGGECLGCNGVPGAYHDEFSVGGKLLKGLDFTVIVGNDSATAFIGSLGRSVPYGATPYGCSPYTPMRGEGEMFLVQSSAAYLFFRPGEFGQPAPSVGHSVVCR